MNSPTPTPRPGRAGSAPRAFTLVEMIVSMTIGLMVLGAVASILVMSLKMVNKNQEIDAAVGNTRSVQEQLNSELAKAISQNTPYVNRPTFTHPNTATPPRYATMVYRIPIGSYGTLQADTPVTSNQIVVTCPSDVTPQVGDYVMMDTPDLDGLGAVATSPGIRILTMTGSGTISMTLASTLGAGTDDTTTTTAKANSLVRIQREREYDVVIPPSGALTTELHWYESTIDVGVKYTVLSTHIDGSNPYLFAQIPLDTVSGGVTVPAPEPSVSWQFNYVSTGAESISQGGSSKYYQSNYAEGLILPKSGNPLSASSILGGGPTTLGTSTTLVSSTTTSATTTSATTTKATTTSATTTSATTTKATTTNGTTTKATTTNGTSTNGTTTKGTTTSATTTKATTTSATTTKATSTNGTSTNGTSTNGTTTKATTTSATTTKATTTSATTTNGTTTNGTTTKGTTTSATTTSATTTKATTTSGTTTMATTTSATTTAGTTTKGTTTTTTSSIPFDG